MESVAQSVSATSHSYTIMPLITASGELKKPLLICLQEPDGKLGPIKTKRLEKVMSDEVKVVASKSGKMTKELFLYWYQTCAVPNLSGKSILLLDSFPAYKDDDARKSLTPEGIEMQVKIVPPHTTSKNFIFSTYGIIFL